MRRVIRMATQIWRKIHEKKCPYCGKLYKTTDVRQIYCSRECGYVGRTINKGNRGDDFEWTKSDGKWDCIYQEGVGCHTRTCETCGWNPKVAEERLKKIRRV